MRQYLVRMQMPSEWLMLLDVDSVIFVRNYNEHWQTNLHNYNE